MKEMRAAKRLARYGMNLKFYTKEEEFQKEAMQQDSQGASPQASPEDQRQASPEDQPPEDQPPVGQPLQRWKAWKGRFKTKSKAMAVKAKSKMSKSGQ